MEDRRVPISVDWPNKLISVPQSYLTLVGGTLYDLDTDAFRLDLRSLEDSDEGMPWPRTHRHNTEVTVAGVTFARTIEIINGYQVEFEDGQYTVRLVGSNNNIFDVEGGVLVQNQVQVIPGNSAGLIVTSSGGVTPAQVWQREIETGFTAEELMRLMAAALAGKVSGAAGTTVTIRDVTDSVSRIVATVDADGNRTAITHDVD